MKVVVCEQFGPVENLEIQERDALRPPPGCVVVDVRAAGVNFVDSLFVMGKYQIKPPLPFAPGGEIAGVISSVADQADASRLGERVLVSCGLGGFSEQVVAKTSSAIQIPIELTFAQAATLHQSYSTALYSLRNRAHLASGEVVLVLGAGGGVGLAAIQIASSMGATVIAAASTEDKRNAAVHAGADMTLDTSSVDLKSAVREIFPTGVDVVVDPIGGQLAELALRTLGTNGRYLVIGFAAGWIPSFPLNQVLLRNRQVIGVDWGSWSLSNPELQSELIGELLQMASKGEIDPATPTLYPLVEASVALRDLLERKVVGKVALTP